MGSLINFSNVSGAVPPLARSPIQTGERRGSGEVDRVSERVKSHSILPAKWSTTRTAASEDVVAPSCVCPQPSPLPETEGFFTQRQRISSFYESPCAFTKWSSCVIRFFARCIIAQISIEIHKPSESTSIP